MEKVRLGKTGLMVSRIGFGGIPIQRLSEAEAVAVVKGCLDLGVTFIDTANSYTTSEGYIGKAIAGRREGLVLATKSTSRDPEKLAEHIDLSLERLGVDTIDLYQFHAVNNLDDLARVTDPQGLMAVMQEAKRAGKIRHIGISCHTMEAAKQAVKSGLFETLMFPFNFIAHEAEEVINLATEHDVGFIGMKPMAGGMLENASLAFKYVLQFPTTVPLVGIEKTQQIEEIVGILSGPLELTAADRIEMQRVSEELGRRFCHRCDYCQPCPEEISISMVMVLPNMLQRMSEQMLFHPESFGARVVSRAEGCSKCGECETRCPYELPIRDMIDEHVHLYHKEKEQYLARSPA